MGFEGVMGAVTGPGLKMSAAQQKGNADAAAANFNAGVDIENANASVAEAANKERQQRVSALKMIGNETASYGASGVASSGSALDVLQDSISKAEMDSQSIKHQGAMASWGYTMGAGLEVSKAASAHIQANYGAASTMIAGATGPFSSMAGGKGGGAGEGGGEEAAGGAEEAAAL